MPLVEFDAVLIERVFCNLLENAAKYAPSGSLIEIAGNVKEETSKLLFATKAWLSSGQATRAVRDVRTWSSRIGDPGRRARSGDLPGDYRRARRDDICGEQARRWRLRDNHLAKRHAAHR